MCVTCLTVHVAVVITMHFLSKVVVCVFQWKTCVKCVAFGK